MLPLYQDPWFTFRFADDRIILRLHPEGIEAGRKVFMFKIDPGTGKRLGLTINDCVVLRQLSSSGGG